MARPVCRAIGAGRHAFRSPSACGHQGLRFDPGPFSWTTVGRSPLRVTEHPFPVRLGAPRCSSPRCADGRPRGGGRARRGYGAPVARRSDTARSPRRRGVLRHYDRPLHRDQLFLLVAGSSLLVTIVFVGIVMLLTGLPADPVDWVRPALLGLLVAVLSFRLLGIGVTTSRKFQEGLRGRSGGPRGAAGPGDPAGHDFEATGRAAGAVVGRALRRTRSADRAVSAAGASAAPPRRDPEADAPASAPDAALAATPSRPTGPTRPTVGRAARVAGAMDGRRRADRRTKDDPR